MNYTRSEIAYAAGVFDIHGSIKIIVPDKNNLSDSSLYIWVTSKYAELMKFLQMFNASVGRVSGGQFRAKWKDEPAYKALKAMLPHLIIKRDQAEVGIEFQEFKFTTNDPKDYVLPLKTRLNLLKRDDIGE